MLDTSMARRVPLLAGKGLRASRNATLLAVFSMNKVSSKQCFRAITTSTRSPVSSGTSESYEKAHVSAIRLIV